MSCDSCGRECTAACGTRQFRACCFNYLRKRGGAQNADNVNDLDPGLRLELWLARGGVLPSQNFIHAPRSASVLGEVHHKVNTLDNEDYRDDRIRSDQI